MIYGSLYKVFLNLSGQKNKNKNELAIPKIYVKVLMNKDKRNNSKNKNKYDINNSDNLINDHCNLTKINSFKTKKNEQKKINKNLFKNIFNFSLPKIKNKKDLSLIQNKENSLAQRKNDISIVDQFAQKENNLNIFNNSQNYYKNRFMNKLYHFNYLLKKDTLENEHKEYHNNINNLSFCKSNKNGHIYNLKYGFKTIKLNEFKELDDINEINRNESEDEKNIKDKNSNLFYNNRYQNNKNMNLNSIEKSNNNDFFSKIYSYGNKKRIKLSKIFDKNKIYEYYNLKKRKSFNFSNSNMIIEKNRFYINFKKLDEIDKKLSNKEVHFPLNKNILVKKEVYYYKVSKMYRNQFKRYFSHRINWKNISKNKNDVTINFEWKYYSNKINYKEYKYDPALPLTKLKLVNLFEKNYEIGNKKNMFVNLINYCDSENINVFEIVPFTMIINNTNSIEDTLDKIEKIMNFVEKNKKSKYNIISKQKYNDIFDDDKYFEDLKNQYIYIDKNFLSLKNYWIIKPPDLYQGKCIEICNSFDELVKIAKNIFKGVDKKLIPEQLNDSLNNDLLENNKLLTINTFHNLNNNNNTNTTYNKTINNTRKKITKNRIYCSNEIIIQKYLDNPLLYKNRKFDIRCFVLLDSNFNLYFCREGHLKGCSELYNLYNSNKYIHITNYSLQKNSNNFELYEIGNEMSYKDFKNFLINEKISLKKFDYMINQMKILIKISFKSVAKKLLKEKQGNILCFEIFGYDFILDNDFKLWILEINNNPGLSISSPVIEKLVPRMMDDAFRLTIDKIFNTQYSNECIDHEGKYKTKYKLDGFRDDENIFEFLCNIGS